MPQSTPNLSLVTYDLTLDAGVYFSVFRTTLAGYTNSALTKIDTWAGQVNADLATLKQSPSIIRVSATKDSDFIYSATVANMTQYSLNQYINLSLSADNVGTVSLNINALGGKSLLKFNNAGTLVNISAKDLRQNKNNLFTYNGTAWVWVNAISSDQLNIPGTSGNLVKISADNTLEDGGVTFSNAVTNNAIVQRTATGQIKGAVASANDDVVNKLYADTIDNKIGLLSALETVDKTSVVGAINENFGHIGNLSTLTTTEKSNLVGATNELNSAIGQLSNLPININPDFKVWQRGTVLDLAYGAYKYTADRWFCSMNFSNAKVEKDGEFAKLTAVNIGSGTDFAIIQGFETIDVIPLRGKKVTFSVNLKKYASMTAGDIVLSVYTGTEIDQVTAWTGRIITTKKINYSELSEIPKPFTLTADVPADTNSLCIIIRVGTIYGNQINNGGSFGVKYAKLELGEIATPLSPRPYSEELALCQRYCVSGGFLGQCYNIYQNGLYFFVPLPQTVRIDPSLITGDLRVEVNGVSQTGFTFPKIYKFANGVIIEAVKQNHGLSTNIVLVSSVAIFDAEIY